MVNGGNCAGEILTMVTDVFNAAISYATAAEDPMGAVEDTITVVQDFDFPVCSN